MIADDTQRTHHGKRSKTDTQSSVSGWCDNHSILRKTHALPCNGDQLESSGMGRVRIGVSLLALGAALASCGRVSRDVPSGGLDAGTDGRAGEEEPPADAGMPTSDAAAPDAAVTPLPCNAADAGTLTWGTTFDDPPDGMTVASHGVQGLTRCGDGLCLLQTSGLLKKFSTEGAVMWSRNIGGQSKTDLFAATSLAADANGNIVLGGYCTGRATLQAASGMQLLSGCGDETNHPQVAVVRLDAFGLFRSAEMFGTSVNYPPSVRVAAEPDGGHAIAGESKDPRNQYAWNGFVVGSAADGTERYHHLFKGGSAQPTDLAFDSHGNAVLVGFFYQTVSTDADDPDGGTPLDTAGSQICVVKLDPKGELSWSRCFGGDSQPALEPSLALGPDDSIFLSGSFTRQLDFDAIGEDAGPSPTRLTTVGPTAVSQPDVDLYVAKLTSGGDFLWQRGLGNSEQQDGAFGLAVTPEGNVILTAGTRERLDIGPFHVDADSSGNGFVLQLDGSGEPSFLTPFGTTRYLSAHNALVLGSCHNFYAAARFSGTLVAPGSKGNGRIFFVAGQY